MISALITSLLVSLNARALVLTSAPTFTPASAAPLAGTLKVSTDVASRVSVSVMEGTNTWRHTFLDYGTTHSLPLLGFKPGRTNFITVTALDRYRNAVTAPQPLLFVSPALPDAFPKSVLLASQPAKMEPGYTLFRLTNLGGRGFLTMVDNFGDVVWYSTATSGVEVRQLPNGNLFLPLATNFSEINLLGQPVRSLIAPPGLAIDVHDAVPTSHGTVLYINDDSIDLPNFPAYTTKPGAPLVTVHAAFNNIVEISAVSGNLLNRWSLLDIVDPYRTTYLTYSSGVLDLQHANAVIEDPSDDSIIVSMRHQNAIIKFDRAGKLKWILGAHDNWGLAFQPYLLKPVGSPFAWSYGQHAPMITPQGTLLVYDDGNFRADPFFVSVANKDNYSRPVEYSINQQTMEVSQVWDYSGTNGPSADRLFTALMGNADWLPQTGNVLVNYSWVSYENGAPPNPSAPGAAMLRIKEVTHDQPAEVVFDLAFFDYTTTDHNFTGSYAYRSHRVPDLYSTLPAPVEDLVVQNKDGNALLWFSGNDTKTYTVQASSDLQQWEDIGEAEGTGEGNFEFTDFNSSGNAVRYYRVITGGYQQPGE
ncbi:MAG TPA: aryl-sulfate sulfotransferase [Verrucomicrobiae bacterium]|nr:aryl-sulfate sulfotransferase [Verrucomicrobiae bacterium]